MHYLIIGYIEHADMIFASNNIDAPIFFLTTIHCYGFILAHTSKGDNLMDRMSSNGMNSFYYFWSYYYFPLVCPSLRRR
jgi:hypothetical protein